MIGLVQRVTSAKVMVDNETVGEIGPGILLLLGVEQEDDYTKVQSMCDKVCKYRIFSDAQGKMNLSLKDTQGEILVVSQFTLVADTNKGLRPSFSKAAKPAHAQQIYQGVCQQFELLGVSCAQGQFAADMQVSLINDGPVTFYLQV